MRVGTSAPRQLSAAVSTPQRSGGVCGAIRRICRGDPAMIAHVSSPTTALSDDHYGPWNPGIESILPREFTPLATVYSSENVSSSVRDLQEISDFCGLSLEKLSTFMPKRLALHEVLIRVMADLTV